jgi:hypothetical protein
MNTALTRRTDAVTEHDRALSTTLHRGVRRTPPSPSLNTILAVREHAPPEIEELEQEIEALHARLAVAHARKRLLEELVRVINSADADRALTQSGMAVVR